MRFRCLRLKGSFVSDSCFRDRFFRDRTGGPGGFAPDEPVDLGGGPSCRFQLHRGGGRRRADPGGCGDGRGSGHGNRHSADVLDASWISSALRSGAKAILPRNATGPEIIAAIEGAALGLVVLHPESIQAVIPVAASGDRLIPAAPQQALTTLGVRLGLIML